MSLDATMHVYRRGRRDAIYEWLQMIFGAALVVFMWCHMILVSSVVISPKIMNAIAWFFEATYMAQLGGPVIFLVFLVHFVIAARKIPFTWAGQKAAIEHTKMMKHDETTMWLVQMITAMVVLVMGSIHMWVVLTDLPITAAKSAARIQTGWWMLFYFILLFCVEFHVSVGWYRILVKWGVIKAGEDRMKTKKLEKRLLYIMLGIGTATLIRFWFLNIG